MPETIEELRSRVHALTADFERALAEAGAPEALQSVRDRFLGRKAGAVTALLKSLGQIPEASRREAGRELNALKDRIEARLAEAKAAAEDQSQRERLGRDRLDITLPGRPVAQGHRHPLTTVREELEDIFVSMGYEVFDGPEVDDDYHCFEALNMPPDHPARDMQDTFYLSKGRDLLLRTHTSTG
jgi:phenylalanyl-tRNA synthetase alpha chain